MKYICLGYMDEAKWEGMAPGEQEKMMKECFAYDEVLRKNGHMMGGEALQSARNAATVRWRDGKPLVTDGPFIETKEQLGGLLILQAKDLNEAIHLMSQHPGIRFGGSFEIRATEELPPAYGPE